MPKRNTNRAYKRGEPHRDMRLFVIVAEGEREDEYFSWFDQRNSRIRVQIVPREGHASAPNHFIKRLETFFRPELTCPEISTAIRNAALQDQASRMHQFPDNMRTKVYLLAEALIEVLGNNWR